MASGYQRGRAKEYTVMDTLRVSGYECTRSASSKGLWDVVAVREDEIRLIQVKLTSTGDFSEDKNCKQFRDLPVPANVRKELWFYAAGEGLIQVRDLKDPFPTKRTEEGRALLEKAHQQAERQRPLVSRPRKLAA